MKYFEVVYDNDTSICIKGVDVPTCIEAEKFTAKDMGMLGAKQVISVSEISKEEAYDAFDMENEKKFPVFIREANIK